MLRIGEQLPNFVMKNQNGEAVTSHSLLGSKTVLYFYPKDNTPTCSDQACDFNNHLDMFNELGVKVYGVSGDSEKKHQNFIKKYDLKFDLLVDEDYQYSESIDVYRLKKVFGKESKGIVRTTIILDEENKIMAIFDKVKVKTQIEVIKQVLESHE